MSNKPTTWLEAINAPQPPRLKMPEIPADHPVALAAAHHEAARQAVVNGTAKPTSLGDNAAAAASWFAAMNTKPEPEA